MAKLPSKPRSARPRDDAADLLSRFQRGDGDAFQALVGEYQTPLVQFFYRLCWDRGRSEDLVQELFLKLLRGAKQYRPEGKLGTFIYRVATNLWIDHYRAVRPQPRLYSLDEPLVDGEGRAGDLVAGEQVDPVDAVALAEDKWRLRQALESLTEPHRLVFELAVYHELPYAQVSEILDIPVGTVKSRMHNAVQALRGLLAPPAAAEEPKLRSARGDVG